MKKLIAFLTASLLVCSCFLLLAGCAKKTEDTIVMATNANFPPYEYKEGSGYAGIDVEIATLIAEKLGKKLEIKDVEFGSIVGGVQTGKFDFGMAGMTVTEERLQSVNFTISYATAVQVAIVKSDAGITSIDDFFVLDAEGNWTAVKDGVKIGVQQDTTGDIYCSDTVENFGFGEANVIRYKNGADAVAALVAGKVTAVIIDNEPAKSFVAANTGLTILDGAYADENYAICVAKENTELLGQINTVLQQLIDDGTVKKIVDKYIKD